MKQPLPTLLLFFFSTFSLPAADTASTTTPEVSTPQPITGTYRILEQRVVQHEGYKITYNRITPPQMSKVPATVARPLTTEEQALADSRQGKAHGTLSIGATVFDHEVTEIHWNSPNGGKRHVAYSNIDFNLVAGLGTFASADTVYSSFLAVGNATRKAQGEERDTGSLPVQSQPVRQAVPPVQSQSPQAGSLSHVPALSEFPSDLSVYLVPADDTFTEADNETLAALDALHAYYDANRVKLQQDYTEREQKRTAQQQWTKEHPPEPKDEVMFIWKKEPAPATAK